MFHLKESIKKWRDDIDIANFQRKQEPDIQCRICSNYIPASQIDYHNQLCLKRIHTKEKASKVDKQFMEILNKITKEILSLSRAKGSSAIIKKRSFFKEQDQTRKLPINSPLITNRGLNKLQDMSKELIEKNKTSTPSMPSRSGPVDFVKDNQLQMNKLVRNDNVNKTENIKSDDFRGGFQFRTFDRADKNTHGIRKPPLPKDKKEEPTIVKEKPEEKSEGKINTTMETTPDINEDKQRKEEIKRMPQQEEEKAVKSKAETNTGNTIRPKDFYSIPEETKQAMNNRANVSFTPGVTKRRLRRDTNNIIDPLGKPTVPVSALPEISLTKPKVDGSINDDKKSNDPLLKF